MFELHTSDFDPCPARTLLKRDGKFSGESGTALVRGLVTHKALEIMHIAAKSELPTTVTSVVNAAVPIIMSELEEQGRVTSESVDSNMDKMVKEIHTIVSRYKERMLPLAERYNVLGVEVPIYWELSEDVHLSSHLDLLMHDPESDTIIAWDWKWRKDSLAVTDLSRNMQLACYWACLKGTGQIQVDCKIPESWEYSGEGWVTPKSENVLVSWIDLPSLKPYSRAVTTYEDGNAVQHKKGDDRPLDRIIRTPIFHDSQINNIRNAALTRADLIMNRIPLYIPQGCSHCECEAWCPRFDMPSEGSVEVTF